MLDISFSELIAVGVVAIVVLGPEDVPKVMYGLGRVVRRLNYVRFSLTQQFDSFMDKHDNGDTSRGVNFESGPVPLRPFPPSASDSVIESTEEISHLPKVSGHDPERSGS